MKLTDINPEAVRDEVLTTILDHLQSYAVPLMSLGGDPRGVVIPSLEEARQSTLGFEILAVAHYARTGGWIAPGETEDRGGDSGRSTPERAQELAHSFAWDALTQVVCALYASPSGDVPVPFDAPADPETAWGVVLMACIARQQLAQGEPVSATQLAALGGVTRQRINQLVDAGTLDAARPAGVTAQSALRWLSGRGVEGL